MAEFDLAIIGGGVNGAGIARDAAGRGLKVLLVEQRDLASGTSSASTKLIHGGLRYLEHGALRLVREALIEREVLLRMAPHLVRPLRFILPVEEGGRAAWMLRLGLFIYDHLGGRKILPPSRALDLAGHPFAHPLRRRYVSGFEYSDCAVDDARLVVLNALDAAERGAVIRTRTRCVRAERARDWTLVLNARGRREEVTARVLVNAAGPWVAQVHENVLRLGGRCPLRLAKGSHIVVRRLFDHAAAYLFQGPDRRVVFALPFLDDFTLIGTTDVDFDADLDMVAPSAEEIEYLCRMVNTYLRETVMPADVVWAYSGVRALYDDGNKRADDVTRDYMITLDRPFGAPPLVTVYGGKITTYRRLAESVMARIADFFVCGPAWTSGTPLPGGDFPHNGVERECARACERWPFLAPAQARRLVASYGTRIARVLGDAACAADLGQDFGAGLTAAEIGYLMRCEWAQTADDVLWRRGKLGLLLSAGERAALDRHMTDAARAPAG
ncbi:MAG: glycerol-3-phosphate dehydrogenase [Proteobacteria bacterium]|nr:glycerol-3-phosphate dehydrogenase [Pseudomonadota bacterium]